ncbi:MAG: hypothetical protein H6659_12095 [Ardenticatenaceae bacterium]|nr:hypothetical protein [Ardenticatenaceae bacterium]MCB8986137.1 hypothetical protein [Ardenticatenaceae bacterium]
METATHFGSTRRSLWALLRPFLLATLMCLSLTIYWLDATGGRSGSQITAVAQTSSDTAAAITETWPAYGVNHISYPAAQPTSEERYQNGLATGASWNRWPMYWHDIEQQPGVYAWSYQDTAVRADIAHGLKLDAILLGTPGFYRTDTQGNRVVVTPQQPTSPFALDEAQTGTPLGLYTAVFLDGSDITGPGKTINPENVWAQFVFTAVNRYKPGGLIAQQEGWPDGVGVTHWEIWNEPDLLNFWDGSVADYARLLKVGYLAAKQADPQAQIIFGGLAVIYDPYDISFLSSVLAIYDQDPTAAHYNYFHDILALHNYSYAYRSWRAVYIAERRLAARNLDKQIWLNEMGVPVWDDYPGPVCDPGSPFRATMTEQADFIIQSALYAAYAGADNLFFFQLYDDCGNVAINPDYFPPEQCAAGPPPGYAGDAFGLFTNLAGSACYAHHPQPGSARPGLAAFQALTTYFRDVAPLWRLRPGETQEWLAFYQQDTQSRLVGLWALTAVTETAVLTSTNSAQTGLLIHPDGLTETIMATNGVFTLTLPPATNQNTPTDQPIHPIGGRPYLLLEPDTLPPVVSVTAPPVAALAAAVSWSGQDWGSGVVSYDVFVKKDSSLPSSWLVDTTAVSGQYPVEMGHTYTFLVMGRDQAGNVSEGTAVTVLAPVLDRQLYLPVIGR